MKPRVAGTFSPVQSQLQIAKESGDPGKHKLHHTVEHFPVKVLVVSILLKVAEEIGRDIHSGEVKLSRINRNPIEGRISETFLIGFAWNSPQTASNSPQTASKPSLSLRTQAAIKKILMAPRFRATPRRGRHSGQRGGDGGRGRYSPRRISPLAQASPPSNRSGDSEQFICNTVQSARFRFRRRTNRPFISTLVTIIFEEEDEEENSMTNSSAEQTPSNPNSSSPSRGIEESSYAPSSQSKIEEESAGDYIEEQDEVIQEIVGLQGKDSLDLAPEHAKISSSRTEEGQGTQSKHKEPEIPFSTLLYPKLPSGMKLEDVPPGMEITWEPLDEDVGQGDTNIK